MTERLEPIKLAQLSRHELIKIIRSIESQLAEKDASIKMLINQMTDEVSISAKAIVERDRLRKALDEVRSHLVYGGVDEAWICISKALGEEVES